MAKTQAIIDLIANDKRFKSAMSRVHGILKRVRTAMQGVAQTARRMIFFGTAAMVGFVKATSDQIKAETKLAAVLKSTENAAGLTNKQLHAQARELQNLTGIGDEVIINTQAILATFKEIKGTHFSRAIRSILDMSTVLDTDLKSAAIQVGKALNDPIRGVTALGRAGVQFTDKQKDVIKGFVEQGNIVAAQAVILQELESQFQGAAKAIGDTLPGALKKAWAALGDMGEQIGSIFIPFITTFANKVVTLSQKIVDWALANKQLVKTGAAVVAILAAIVAIIPTLSVALIGLSSSVTVLSALLPLLTATAGVIAATAAALLILTKRIYDFNRQPIIMQESLEKATTALNDASEAAMKLNDALRKGDYKTALEAAEKRSTALAEALEQIRKEAAEVRKQMSGDNMIFNQEQLAARLITLNKQAYNLQQQLNSAKNKEEKIRNTIARQAEAQARRDAAAAKRAEEIAQRKKAEEEYLAKNQSLLEQIREVTDEIAVLDGKISEERAEINRLTAKGEDIILASRLVALKALREERQRARDKEKALKDEAKAIRESLMTDKQRLNLDIARVKQIERAGHLTKMEAALKIAALQKEFSERTRINQFTGTIQSAEALYRRTQEAAGARSPKSQQALAALGSKMESIAAAEMKKTDENTLAIRQFQSAFERTVDESTVVGRFGR